MGRRKTKTNAVKKASNVSTSPASTKLTNNSIKDDPGGTNDELKKLSIVSATTTTINNCTNVDYLKSSTKDQIVTSVATTTISSSPVTSTSSSTIVANDSKYLHKKFKKFCATVDSSSHHQTNNSHINNNSNANSTPTSDGSLNNNSEIVVNKNSSSNNNWQSSLSVPSNHPKHSLTTEEEKQLVKDIIDINNENFMHQSANNFYHHHLNNNISSNNNQSTSSFLIAPTAAVTTLGNHNSNFQQLSTDHRQKVSLSSHQEVIVGSFNPSIRNENFVIVNNGQQPHQPSIEPSHNHQQPPTTTINSSVPTLTSSTTTITSTTSTPGRYICPYCQLNCAKPSVLQKHIRAHTNERPFPCKLCGFAFKTKSNLYKHCRSRSHIQRCNGETDLTASLISNQPEEDGCSLESGDIDETESVQLETMNRLSSPSVVMESQMNGHFENSSSSSSNSSATYSSVNPPSDTLSSSSTVTSAAAKPYKPKFHNYKKLDIVKAAVNMTPLCIASVASTSTAMSNQSNISTPSTPLTPSFFGSNHAQLTPQIIEERISKIISDNEAIVDNREALLQKKYHKITGIQRNLSTTAQSPSPVNLTYTQACDAQSQSNSKLALALLKQQQQQKQHDEEILRYQMTTSQPLNLIKIQEPLTVDVGSSPSNTATPRRRYLSENPSPLVITTNNQPMQQMTQQQVIQQLQSPPDEKQQQQQHPTQLVIPSSHPQNPEGSIIKDLLLNSKNFGAVDSESGDATYTCPTCKLSFRGADILKYHLICHCQGEENIMSKSAPISPQNVGMSSPYYPRSSSEKCSPTSLSQLAQIQLKQTSKKNPSSLQNLAKSLLKVPKHKPENITINPAISAINKPMLVQTSIKNPLPSPGPLLGNTRLVDKREDDFAIAMKKPKLEFPSPSDNKQVMTMFVGDMKLFQDKTIATSKNFPSGGGLVSGCGTSQELDCKETSPNTLQRQGLSGGIVLELKKESPTTPPVGHMPVTPKLIVTITPTLTPTLTSNSMLTSVKSNHFQFPSTVTAYNPLTLPLMSTASIGSAQSIVHGGRVIPYVPGIPGPNSMALINKNDLPPPPAPFSSKEKRQNSPLSFKPNGMLSSPRDTAQIMPKPNGVPAKKKSFNFARIADSINDVNRGERKNELGEFMSVDDIEMKPSKSTFLRPNSLSLKPGTFTPKQHHGITPTANTMPLISPETPRPSKTCVQLYLNGHAYTYLGLKSSTKTFYCTVNKPQPTYIQNQHKLSMYSNWQIYNGNNPNIFDLSPYASMSLYDSRHKSPKYSVATEKKDIVSVVEMQSSKTTPQVVPSNFQIQQVNPPRSHEMMKEESLQPPKMDILVPNAINGITIDENDDYTYVRGRGRGKYVCEECGIRCKKPSMLKKHMRTHTDLRPYTCSYCDFSFKTKGNLTKHMKSKAHFKKCTELGISPDAMLIDDEQSEFDDTGSRGNMSSRGNEGSRPESEDDENESDDDGDDESSEDTDESKSRMPEHEAAQLLLSLSNQTAAITNTSANNSQPINHLNKVANWNEAQETQAEILRNRVLMARIKSADFDLLNHEKYYSDPTLNRPKEIVIAKPIPVNHCEDDAVPMDLTKKPSKTETSSPMIRVADVITKISGPALLMNHLMSNMDKMPASPSMNFTDNLQFNEGYLPQEYITERALKDVRMKQSQQMTKSTSDYSHRAMFALNKEIPITVAEEVTPIYVRQNITIPSHSSPQPSTSASAPIVVVHSNGNTKNGFMDTLADLAAKSDKLEVKEQQIPSKATANAKNIASEILKLTQQKNVKGADEIDALSDQDSQDTSKFMLTPQTVVVGEDGFHKKLPVQGNQGNSDQLRYTHIQDDGGRPVCVICKKIFQKPGQLRMHMNIHYMERKHRCEACGVSFRTQGHLQKHERSASHLNKVNMTSTFGVPTVSNPRPFKCKDCKIAFRIHGHLAKHLRSKMHVLKLECLQKLPFGTYAEMERSGFNLTVIDTSDCDNSLMSLRQFAKRMHESDPSKLGPLPPLSEDPSENDENGMNDNYDSDSSDLGMNTANTTDDDSTKRKFNDNEDGEIAMKRIKIANENEKIVPSSSSPAIQKVDD